MPVTRNLPTFAGIFSVSMSLLHMIMLPLRLMGLIIVAVALMKEPLMKETCATSEKSWVRFAFGAILLKEKRISSPVLLVIFQLRSVISLVHQNITVSLEHVSSLPTRTSLPDYRNKKNQF